MLRPVAFLLLFAALATSLRADPDAPAGLPLPETDYALTTLDGAMFPATATLRFTADGRIAGRAPCNVWSAALLAPLPAFSAGPVVATRMACPDLAAEAVFLAALARMSTLEVTATGLVLGAADGSRMEFVVQD